MLDMHLQEAGSGNAEGLGEKSTSLASDLLGGAMRRYDGHARPPEISVDAGNGNATTAKLLPQQAKER